MYSCRSRRSYGFLALVHFLLAGGGFSFFRLTGFGTSSLSGALACGAASLGWILQCGEGPSAATSEGFLKSQRDPWQEWKKCSQNWVTGVNDREEEFLVVFTVFNCSFSFLFSPNGGLTSFFSFFGSF